LATAQGRPGNLFNFHPHGCLRDDPDRAVGCRHVDVDRGLGTNGDRASYASKTDLTAVDELALDLARF